jgi:hypothetical protein
MKGAEVRQIGGTGNPLEIGDKSVGAAVAAHLGHFDHRRAKHLVRERLTEQAGSAEVAVRGAEVRCARRSETEPGQSLAKRLLIDQFVVGGMRKLNSFAVALSMIGISAP